MKHHIVDSVMEKIIAQDLEHQELEPNFWTMSNHKWALFAWASAELNQSAVLVHLDWHWDGINDFRDPESRDELSGLASLDDLREMIADRARPVDYASFIAPAILLELVDEVHFYCLQNDTSPGLSSDLLHETGAKEYRHHDIDDLLRTIARLRKPILFDLDIDLFNRATTFYSDGPEYHERIHSFIEKCSDLIQRAAVVTIAKSPSNYWIKNEGHYDWDEVLAEELFNKIVPVVRGFWRGAS
jgi:hypothetical protein